MQRRSRCIPTVLLLEKDMRMRVCSLWELLLRFCEFVDIVLGLIVCEWFSWRANADGLAVLFREWEGVRIMTDVCVKIFSAPFRKIDCAHCASVKVFHFIQYLSPFKKCPAEFQCIEPLASSSSTYCTS